MVSPTALFALYNLLTVWPHGCNGLPVATGVHRRAQTGQTSDWASSHACPADIIGVDGESDAYLLTHAGSRGPSWISEGPRGAKLAKCIDISHNKS